MLAEQLFPTACSDLLATAAAVLGVDAPATRYVIIGPPVAPNPGDDGCEAQLTVGLTGTFPSRTPLQRDATGNQAKCNVVTVIGLTITLYECSPTMDDMGDIDPALISAQALNQYRLMSKLWFGVLALGTGAFPSFPGLTCNGINWGQVSPGTNLGGAAGLNWSLSISIG